MSMQEESNLIDPSKFVDQEITNTRTNVIQITEDKLHVILLKHASYLEIKNSWIAPLSVSISLLATLLTASFETFLGVDAAVWNAIFIVSLAVCLLWLARSLYARFSAGDKCTIEFLISRMKNEQTQV